MDSNTQPPIHNTSPGRLSVSALQYRTVLDVVEDAIYAIDADLQFVILNCACQRMFREVGLSPDVIGQNILDVLSFLPASMRDDYRYVFTTGKAHVDVEVIQIEEREFITEVRMIPVFEGDRVTQVVTIVRDITEQHRAREALEAALDEARRRSRETELLLIGASAVLEYREFPKAARAVFDAAKAVIGATSGYVALLSLDGAENEVLFLDSGGRPCSVDPQLPMPIRGLREVAYRTNQVVYDNDFAHSEWWGFLPDGHVALDNAMFAPLVIEGHGAGLLGLANKPGGFTPDDARMAAAFGELAAIALRNSQTLESLENSEYRFRSVVETAGDAIVSTDSAGMIVFWNPAAERIFGYTAAEAIGQPVTLLMAERFHARHQERFQHVAATGETRIVGHTVELAGRHQDGHEFPLELSLATWVNREGRFFTAILRDITERKQAEARTLELAIERERAGVLARFIGDATHDLRTPLTTIKLSLHLLENAPETEDRLRHLGIFKTQVAHLDRLLEDLLSMSRLDRPGEFRFRKIDLNTLVGNVIHDHRPLAEQRGHALTFSPDAHQPTVRADGDMINRAVSALVTNALNFTPEGGTITLRTGVEGQRAFVEVQDTGIGISPDDLPRIFERFYRADAARSTDKGGVGLGLAIAQKIVMAHRGSIHVESAPGEGSTFTLWLPVANGQAAE